MQILALVTLMPCSGVKPVSNLLHLASISRKTVAKFFKKYFHKLIGERQIYILNPRLVDVELSGFIKVVFTLASNFRQAEQIRVLPRRDLMWWMGPHPHLHPPLRH